MTQIVVIAGNAYNIGAETARLFAAQGAQVVLIDHLLVTQSAMRFMKADLTSVMAIQDVARNCESELSHVNVLFNVAGSNVIRQSFEHTTEDTWSTMIARNLSSAFWCSKYFLPLLKKAGGASIINHASIDGYLGNPSIAAYSAAKGGVLPLTHVMAHDLAKYNIRVNSISTGGIRPTPAPGSRADEARIAVTPSARMGTPQDVAPVAMFLASAGASYVNGANIVVDGGRTVTTHGCYTD